MPWKRIALLLAFIPGVAMPDSQKLVFGLQIGAARSETVSVLMTPEYASFWNEAGDPELVFERDTGEFIVPDHNRSVYYRLEPDALAELGQWFRRELDDGRLEPLEAGSTEEGGRLASARYRYTMDLALQYQAVGETRHHADWPCERFLLRLENRPTGEACLPLAINPPVLDDLADMLYRMRSMREQLRENLPELPLEQLPVHPLMALLTERGLALSLSLEGEGVDPIRIALRERYTVPAEEAPELSFIKAYSPQPLVPES